MSRSIIKKARLRSCMTQVGVAEAMGVSQPTYQRWESGAANVPKGKLSNLAKVLGVTVHQLSGKPEPFDLFGIDKNIADDRTYYGEVAIHFRSGSAPLLLPVSEAERSALLTTLQGRETFVEVSSLDNRTVYVRREAIADVFFSSEAYDDYGPDVYGDQHLGIHPDDSFWTIVEHYDCPECLDGEFTDQEIEEARARFSLTEHQLDELVEDGHIPADKREVATEDARAETDRFLQRARCVCWQLPEQRVRYASVDESKDLYETFCMLNLSESDEFLYLAPEGYHRSLFINLATIDYIAVPTHKFREGEIESHAEELGETT
ncbi:MAG: helix-turn-helix transcriptional regulator [Burkholderiales bacterium]|nr:helix-turn-helix transcriptional regulator [Burkholderiales bacterium]